MVEALWEMRPVLYVLDKQGTPVPMKDGSREEVLKWARSLEETRIVKQSRGRGLLISTVFLGVDYAFQGPPECWETMVLEDNENFDSWHVERCRGGREQAEAMHAAVCKYFHVPA